MGRAAALKAVRTMRANRSLRSKHRYKQLSAVDVVYGQKTVRMGRASKAVSHRKGKGKIKWGPGHPLYDWKQKHGK